MGDSEQFSGTLLDSLLQPPSSDHVSRITTGPEDYVDFLC